MLWLCLGIFLGTTYPFIWKFIKAYFEKGIAFVKSYTKETK